MNRETLRAYLEAYRQGAADVNETIERIVLTSLAAAARPGSTFAPPPQATLRDDFAKHAPTEIPAWFGEVRPLNLPTQPGDLRALEAQPAYSLLTEDGRNRLLIWMADPSELAPELVAIGRAAQELQNRVRLERMDLQELHDASRFIAWRWWYADRMLQARHG